MAVIENVGTVTAKGRTTIPRAVRHALGVDYGGTIAFRVDERGVSVHRADVEHEDPALVNFLALLARDIERRPEAIKPLVAPLAERLARATEDIEVDLDAPVDSDVDL